MTMKEGVFDGAGLVEGGVVDGEGGVALGPLGTTPGRGVPVEPGVVDFGAVGFVPVGCAVAVFAGELLEPLQPVTMKEEITRDDETARRERRGFERCMLCLNSLSCHRRRGGDAARANASGVPIGARGRFDVAQRDEGARANRTVA
jgi:hypothetical protein